MNPNAKNLPEFKKLIERYETITIEEIEEECGNYAGCINWGALIKLTGFGSRGTCTLCSPLFDEGAVNCHQCVYEEKTGCTLHETYAAIENAEISTELLSAYRARAKYMRTLIEK